MASTPITYGAKSLQSFDPEIYALIQHEQQRQREGLELIASENFTSHAVMETLGTCLTNKYSEGLPHKRYYGGNEIIDQVEVLCQQRALKAFHLTDDVWGVNVQPYSGSPANFAVYTALLQPHDRVMGLDLPSGGHLTHGYYTAKKKISATSIYFESFPYKVGPDGLIDFDYLRQTALVFRPKMIIAGGSAYPREWDYARFKEICKEVGALLFVDMAHYSGLVASKVLNSPFDYADVVTTTTHKSLRGPRAGMIFFRKEFEERINFAVFPGIQGGPHNNVIGAIAVQLKEVASEEFKQYSQQIVKNCQALAKYLVDQKYSLATGGSDNHLILWDLRPQGITGSKVETLCDELSITLNKNAVAGDTSALVPGGVRIGTPALTSRGFVEKDFVKVGEFLHETLQLALKIQSAAKDKTLVAFKDSIQAHKEEVHALKAKIIAFASTFPMPGLSLPATSS